LSLLKQGPPEKHYTFKETPVYGTDKRCNPVCVKRVSEDDFQIIADLRAQLRASPYYLHPVT
jgi:hypothetical protein